MNILGSLLVELGINSAAFHSGIDKATYAGKQFASELKSSFAGLSNSITQLGTSIGAGFGPIGGIVSGVTQSIAALSAAMKTAGTNVPGMMQLAGAAAGIGGAAIAAAAGFATLSIEGSHLADELIKNSEKLGVTIEQMGALQYMADLTDLPIQTLVRGFGNFAKQLAQVGQKVTPATSLLKELGVTAHTTTYAGLSKALDGIRAMEDPVQRMNAATTLFTRRLGLQLLPAIEDTNISLEELTKKAKDAGLSLDGAAIAKTRDWKMATVDLDEAWKGFKLSMANTDWVTTDINLLKEAVEWATKLANMKKPDVARHDGASAEDASMGDAYTSTGDAAQNQNDAAFAASQDKAAAATAVLQLQKKAIDEDDKKAEQRKVDSAQKYFETMQAGGPAAMRLKELQDDIKTDEEQAATQSGKKALALWNDAAAKTKLLDMAREEARLEKETADTYANRSKFYREAMRQMKEEAIEKEKLDIEDGKRNVDLQHEQDEARLESLELQKKYAKEIREPNEKKDASSSAGGFRGDEKVLQEQHARGLTSEKQYADALIKLYVRERDAKAEALSYQMKEQEIIRDDPKSTDPEVQAAKLKLIELQREFNTEMDETNKKIEEQLNAIRKADATWSDYFGKMKADTSDLKGKLNEIGQQTLNKGMQEFSSALAKSVVEGNNLGKAMQGVARAIAEQVLQSLILLAVKKALGALGLGDKSKQDANKNMMMAESEAGLAAAAAFAGTMVESMGNIPAALSAAAEADAVGQIFVGQTALGSAEKGGIVGQTGLHQLHAKEMILPAPISEKVQKMADPDANGGGNKGAQIHLHNNYSAIDSQSMEAVLSDHQQHISNLVVRELRRRNMV